MYHGQPLQHSFCLYHFYNVLWFINFNLQKPYIFYKYIILSIVYIANIFLYVRTYGKRITDTKETWCRYYMGYSFRLAARDLLYALSHKQDSIYHGRCYTSCRALAGIRNISMGPPWRIDPTTHWSATELQLTPVVWDPFLSVCQNYFFS